MATHFPLLSYRFDTSSRSFHKPHLLAFQKQAYMEEIPPDGTGHPSGS